MKEEKNEETNALKKEEKQTIKEKVKDMINKIKSTDSKVKKYIIMKKKNKKQGKRKENIG